MLSPAERQGTHTERERGRGHTERERGRGERERERSRTKRERERRGGEIHSGAGWRQRDGVWLETHTRMIERQKERADIDTCTCSEMDN